MAKRKTPEQKLAEIEKKQSQLKAQAQATKAKIRQSNRKKDTRKKIIAGALALEHAEINPGFGEELKRLLQEHVTRPEDRKLFGL